MYQLFINFYIVQIQFLFGGKILKDGFGTAEHQGPAFMGHIYGKM